jgi:hypothetical protein
MRNVTAMYLAVLYGVVGVGGESLHYLAADPTVLWSGTPSGDVLVYYHTHGPDYHGHFHRQVNHHHDDHSHASPATAQKPDASERSPAFAPEAITHEPHACPLLSLVSTLKLTSADCCATVVILDALVAPIFVHDWAAEFDAIFSQSARGPPSAFLA